MAAVLGLTNLIDGATVTVTSEATDKEKENAYDWRTSDWWQANAAGTVYYTVDMGAATAVDCWAVGFHDLNDNSGTIKPQYSTDNFAADINDLDTVQTPSDGNLIFRTVTQRSVRYYRFEVSSTGSASNLGLLYFGAALNLPKGMKTGFRHPKYYRDDEIMNYDTDTGNFVGRAIRRMGYKTEIKQTGVTQSWIDTNFDTITNHVLTKPFLFLHDSVNYPSEAAFCIAQNDSDWPRRAKLNHSEFNLKCMVKIA